MKAPRPIGTPVDMARMHSWIADFANYRYTVSENRVGRWLSQFDLPDLDLAARVLDCVDFIGNEKIAGSFRAALQALAGWDRDPKRRKGKWCFAAFSSSAGESGDVMLQKFRHANNLASSRFNPLFLHRSELLRAGLGPEDKIIFVDDFAGTGKQATGAWPLLSELLPEGPEVHLLLVAATKVALTRIADETELLVQADIILDQSDAVFNDACKRFSPEDKSKLKAYCQRSASITGAPFSAQGDVIVFAHSCPNNSLPILHGQNEQWEGLFRRYD